MSVTQKQLRLLKCVPDPRGRFDRNADWIAARWNKQADLVSMFGAITPNAAFARLARLEERGLVTRKYRPAEWELTAAGQKIVDANTFEMP